MKHEISIKYDDQTREVNLFIDGDPEELANALEDLGPDEKAFLAILATIVEVAKKKIPV